MERTHPRPADHAGLVRSTLLLVLSSETVLFGTLVMAYLFLRAGGSDMPFPHIGSLDLTIASLNTLVLVGSTLTARKAQRAVATGHVDLLENHLLQSLLLGAVFVAGQIFEFNHAGMQIGDSAFGGVFFALIAFHALHVIAGMSFLGLNFARARAGDFSARRHEAVTAGTWFWYYVAAVWLVLFTSLYVV